MPERQHVALAHRWYTFPEMIDCFRRNFWIFIQATVGIFPGLDPEQEGAVRLPTRADRWTWFLLPAFIVGCYWSGVYGLVFWLISPLFPFFFFELGNEDEPGPRVWLPRWYVAVLGVVLMLEGAPAFVRWGMFLWWCWQSLNYSPFYADVVDYWDQVKKGNPNRTLNHRVFYGFLLLNEGRYPEAEEELAEVLRMKPEHAWANRLFLPLEMNRAHHRAGRVGVGFRCPYCQTQALGLLENGERLTAQEHAMFFFRVCPQCGKRSPVQL